MNSKTKSHLAVIGTNLFFAANYSFIKLISPLFIKPFGVNVLRVGISLLLFWIVWLFGKQHPGIQRKDIGRFILCGLTGVAINQTFFIQGLTLTSTVHASLLILGTPLLITILAFWIFKESITAMKFLGLALGISGAALLIFSKENTVHANNYLLGDILILLNAISYAIYFILVKPLMENYSPLHVIRWVFTFGCIMILPIGWHDLASINWHSFELKHFIALGTIVLTGTFLAYYFNAYGIQHLGPAITGSYIYSQPVFAILIAAIFFSEVLTVQKVIAGIMIFSGVYLVSSLQKKSKSLSA